MKLYYSGGTARSDLLLLYKESGLVAYKPHVKQLGNVIKYCYYNTKKTTSLRYVDICFMHNIGEVSDRRLHNSLSMYYNTKKSTSLRYVETCFMHNIVEVSDR